MCDINPQIHSVVQNPNGTFSVQRYNHVTKRYEVVHTCTSEIDANEIKRELDADLQG